MFPTGVENKAAGDQNLMTVQGMGMCLSPDFIRGIMGNQGKFTKKQSCKTNVFLYISVLISHLVTKHVQQAEKPLF